MATKLTTYKPFLTPEFEAELTWPLTIENFEQVTGLKGSTARMRLKKMKEAGEIERIAFGKYDLPRNIKKYKRKGKNGYPLITSLEAAREQLEILPWPMNTKKFHEYTDVERIKSNSWLNQLYKEGYLRRLAKGVYGLPIQEVKTSELPASLLHAEPRFSLDNLSKGFTPLQFGEEHGLDARTVSRYLQRFVEQGHVYRVGHSLLTKVPPLPLTFTAQEFAEFFDLDLTAVGEALAEHVRSGETTQTETGYQVSETQRADLIRAYFGIRGFEQLGGIMRDRARALPQYDWPMRDQDYAEASGLTLSTARASVQNFCKLGLLVELPEKQGRAKVYDLAPNISKLLATNSKTNRPRLRRF